MNGETQWADARWHMARIEHPVEYLIGITPTGELRNKLTEANIHLMSAKSILEQAYSEARNAGK